VPREGHRGSDIRSFRRLCETIGLSLIGMTIDTGHAALADGLEETVAAIGRYVDHIHLDDSSLLRERSPGASAQARSISPPSRQYLRTFDGMLTSSSRSAARIMVGPS